jgi:tetratricopeptide (TPR) repeat protein
MDPITPPLSTGGALVNVHTLALPEKAVLELEKGSSLLKRDRAKESLEHFDKAIAAAPSFCEAYYLKGMALLQLQAGYADAMLSKSIELNSKFMPAYYPLALSLFSEHRYQEEQKLLQAAMQQEPNSWQWPFEMARSLATEKQWYPAARYVQMALSRPNAASKVRLLASDIYSNSGSPEKAVEQLEEFLKQDPGSPYAKRVNEVLPTLRRQAAGTSEKAAQRASALETQ